MMRIAVSTGPLGSLLNVVGLTGLAKGMRTDPPLGLRDIRTR